MNKLNKIVLILHLLSFLCCVASVLSVLFGMPPWWAGVVKINTVEVVLGGKRPGTGHTVVAPIISWVTVFWCNASEGSSNYDLARSGTVEVVLGGSGLEQGSLLLLLSSVKTFRCHVSEGSSNYDLKGKVRHSWGGSGRQRSGTGLTVVAAIECQDVLVSHFWRFKAPVNSHCWQCYIVYVWNLCVFISLNSLWLCGCVGFHLT